MAYAKTSERREKRLLRAAGQLGPVLELPSDQRISTVTGYLARVGGMLRAPRFGGSPLAVQFGEQIREFTSVGATATTGS